MGAKWDFDKSDTSDEETREVESREIECVSQSVEFDVEVWHVCTSVLHNCKVYLNVRCRMEFLNLLGKMVL